MKYSNSMKCFIIVMMICIGYWTTSFLLLTSNFFYQSNIPKESTSSYDVFGNNEISIEEEASAIDGNNDFVMEASSHNDYYPFEIENNYALFPDDSFDITLVTYLGMNETSFISEYCSIWKGPAIMVLWYKEKEEEEMNTFLSTMKQSELLTIIPVVQDDDVILINRLKNIGIGYVQTTHFIFVEFNLIPSKSLYKVLKKTPGYLWRDPYFVGVVPVFEWSSQFYKEAEDSRGRMSKLPHRNIDIVKCLKEYTCRPRQTTTIPMQFGTFSYIHYRNMNCINANTELFVVLKKSDYLPFYDESITKKGYDNVAYIEMLRRSSMKFGLLADEFLFQVPGIGQSSDVVFENWKNDDLQKQYQKIIDKYSETGEKLNPTTFCEDVEGAMHTWIGFTKYIWLDEETIDGKVYPKIAVKRGKNNKLVV